MAMRVDLLLGLGARLDIVFNLSRDRQSTTSRLLALERLRLSISGTDTYSGMKPILARDIFRR